MKSKEGIEFSRTRGVKKDFSARTKPGTSALELEQKEMTIKRDQVSKPGTQGRYTSYTGLLKFSLDARWI